MKHRIAAGLRALGRLLAPLRSLIIDARDWCADTYLTNSVVRSTVDSITTLLGLVVLDCILGFPISFRLIYIAPVWLAAQRGGRRAGLILVMITALVLTAIDMRQGLMSKQNLALNSILLFGVLYGLMRLIERTENQLQTYASMATRDSLTGIANRLAFEEFASRSLDKALLAGDSLSVVMVDCDRFKQLNDTYGHAYGDHVLKTLAKILRRGVQPSGFAARTGGDEFILVLPGKTALDACRILERLQSKFSDATEFSVQRSSFSFGIAELGENGISIPSLLIAADKDLYQRKNSRSAIALLETPTLEIA